MAGPDPVGFLAETVRTFLTDVLAIIGIGLGGGQAAAAAELVLLQQSSMEDFLPTVLSPEQLAAAVVKGAVDTGVALGQAAKSGVNADNFQGLIDIAGNPPGPGQLFDLWNRDDISAAEVEMGLKQGYLRPEWIDVMKNLRRNLLGLGELVAGVVQAQLSQEDGAGRAAMLGYDATDFDLAVRTAGNPPGPQQALTMWQRGLLNQAETEQALRESRLKNKYIPAFMQLVRRRIPARTITTLLTHGAIDDGTAHQYLLDLGYSDADATAYVTSARYTRSKTNHDLSVAQIRQLYVERVMTRDVAVQSLVTAGYTNTAATEILQLADVQADHRIQTQAINAVRGRYVGHRLDVAGASTALDGIGVPSDQRDHLLSVWTFEREANVSTLTLAQVTAATKKGALTVDEWHTRVLEMGYSEPDAQLLAMVDGFIPIPGQGA